MKLRISPLLIAVPAILALTACGTSTSKIGGQPRKSVPILEYVSLSPSTTEMLSTVGIPGNRILGRTASCNYPPNFSKIKIVVNGTTPDFELIASLKPQRVIAEKDLYSEATIQKLKDLGLDVLIVDTDTPQNYEDTLIKIGKDSGAETNASTYLDKVYGAESLLKGSIAEGMKIAVVIGDATTGYMIQGKNTLLGNFIKGSPGEFVGPDSGKFEPVSIEQLINYNPEIIITQMGEGEKMLANPQLKAVPAVAKGHILGVESDILLRNGGRVEKLLEGIATGIGRIERKGN
ncbi:MAG: ABC transporter substrate-binding protein [Fimbriimonadaceae bacterium]